MTTAKRACPNCFNPIKGHGFDTGCALGMLIGQVSARGEVSPRKLNDLWARANADALWDDLGPIVDRLSDGGYL